MESVECIVVGGGLAGLSAAYGLAAAGVEVMVVERGGYPGAKNVTGGRLYLNAVRELYPELWAEAPLERPVARELATFTAGEAATTVEIASRAFVGARPQSATVLRARLDQWLAEKATAKGAMLVSGMKVDELLRSEGRVVGIRAGEDSIGAGVVVVAEGALRLLSAAAGLAAEPQPRHYALGYKEVIELPAGVIEDRWRLEPGEGAAQLFVGDVTRGLTGGGFLYTNRDSISLGVVVGMDAMLRAPEPKVESWRLLDDFRQQPHVRPLVAGGVVVEYAAHAIPEGGISQVPRLAGDGYLLAGDAAGLSLNALITVRGMDFAIASGFHAAQAVLRARGAGDYSAAALASYEAALRDSFVLKDLQTAGAVPGFMENERLYGHYPAALCRLLERLYTVGPGPARGLAQTVWSAAWRELLSVQTLRDAWAARHI